MKRDFDVIVWGATGFTGRLVARYLCEQYGFGSIRWAIAGRSGDRLRQVREQLASLDARASDLPILVADSADRELLRAMAQRTQVVLTTVGPYAKYGAPLVEVCAEEGTDYVDLCGEPQFIRRMVDAHHETVRQRRGRIVHCCGFDSIPSDIGVFVLQRAAQETFGQPLPNVTLYVERTRGGVSGGTLASMMHVLDEARDPQVRRLLADPYALCPQNGVRGPDGGDQQSVRWDPDRQVWTAPFVMAAINTRVVRRSNALLDYAWGRDFSYREVTALPGGLSGWLKARQLQFGLAAFTALAWPRWTRSLMQATILPKPGEGPSEQDRENGFFRLRLAGRGTDRRLDVICRGKRDPGYGATSRMLAESALCLACDRDRLPDRYGVLTPASGLGEPLIDRLAQADVTFDVESRPSA